MFDFEIIITYNTKTIKISEETIYRYFFFIKISLSFCDLGINGKKVLFVTKYYH